MARAFGWTANEVRATTYRDLRAMSSVLKDEARASRMARAHRR